MADPIELPTDVTALDDEQLLEILDGARSEFAQMSAQDTITDDSLARMRALAATVDSIRSEQVARIEAAQQAAAEIETLAAQIRGDDGAPAEPVAAEPAEEPQQETASADPAPAPAAVEQPLAAPEAERTASATLSRPALNLGAVRRAQPRVLPEPSAPTTHITAAVDVPGYTPGADLNFDDVVRGINSRATALKAHRWTRHSPIPSRPWP
ncbi:major capsid protein [Streptomyces cellulosae]|nr:major capsid protein [Streptomyces cellulosae]